MTAILPEEILIGKTDPIREEKALHPEEIPIGKTDPIREEKALHPEEIPIGKTDPIREERALHPGEIPIGKTDPSRKESLATRPEMENGNQEKTLTDPHSIEKKANSQIKNHLVKLVIPMRASLSETIRVALPEATEIPTVILPEANLTGEKTDLKILIQTKKKSGIKKYFFLPGEKAFLLRIKLTKKKEIVLPNPGFPR
jgi:hypothetical protein